jgi:hypothetical protein
MLTQGRGESKAWMESERVFTEMLRLATEGDSRGLRAPLPSPVVSVLPCTGCCHCRLSPSLKPHPIYPHSLGCIHHCRPAHQQGCCISTPVVCVCVLCCFASAAAVSSPRASYLNGRFALCLLSLSLVPPSPTHRHSP